MSLESIPELTYAVNAQARECYPSLARQLGMSSLITRHLPRVALRADTPYPYRFVEDDEFYPFGESTFGRVIEASRTEGLQEIHNSISEKDQEHQWLYVPEQHRWIDATLGAAETYVDGDQYLQIWLSHLFPTVETVHTHPDKTVQKLAADAHWEFTDNYLLEAARPSSSDFMRHNQMTARTNPASLQKSSIVSHYGVTTFTSNDTNGESGCFSIDSGDWLIKKQIGVPAQTIRSALDRVASHVLLHSGVRAVTIDFEPIGRDTQ